MKWTRVAVMLHETSEARPILGIGASSDGGLMISPGNYVPAPLWEFGVAKVAGGSAVGLPGSIERSTVEPSEVAPKLHYHRSGWVSVNLTSDPRRRSVRCLPLERLRGAQCFSYVVTNINAVPLQQLKRGDMLFVAHARWPRSVVVHGFLFSHEQLSRHLLGQRRTDNAVSLVQASDQAELIVDLSGHGFPAVLVLRFAFDDDLPADPDGRPNALLFGFDTWAVVLDVYLDAVGLWTASDVPKVIPLMEPDMAPSLAAVTEALAAEQPDIDMFKRRTGGSSIPVLGSLHRP